MTCEACKDRLVKSELQIKSLERILERAKGIETLFHNFRNATIIEST